MIIIGGGGGGVFFKKKPMNRNLNCEVDIMRHSGGILEIEELIENDNIFFKDAAIKRFIQFCEYAYINFGGFYNDTFLRLSRDFVENLVEVKIVSKTPFYNPHLLYRYIKIHDNLEYLFSFGRKLYTTYLLKKMTRHEYRTLAKDYLYKLFSTIQSNDYLLLDQFLSDISSNIDSKLEYFYDIKMIAVYRDPRDVYATAILLDEQWIPKTAQEFIKWYTILASWVMNINSQNCLVIRFEDFVLDYNNTASEIMKFLGLSEKNHIYKQKIFDPNVSKNNIGLYKKIKDQDAVKQIEQAFPEYIYRG
jgi:hypothetical protein